MPKISWSQHKEYHFHTTTHQEGRVPLSDYNVPILEALVHLGGSATPKEVRELVFPKMKHILTKYDLDPPRWINRVSWARLDLVRAGLLEHDSPYNFWEISDEGREWLKSQTIDVI